MKTQSFVLSLVLLFFFGSSAFAQSAQKDTIKVWGNCGMCKKTIETAAAKAGASVASWDTETRILSVSYNGKKTSAEKIQKAVAAAGYDTRDFTAPDAAYDKLHGCCKYDRKAEGAAKMDSCCGNEKCSKEDSKTCCKDMDACKDKSCCKS